MVLSTIYTTGGLDTSCQQGRPLRISTKNFMNISYPTTRYFFFDRWVATSAVKHYELGLARGYA